MTTLSYDYEAELAKDPAIGLRNYFIEKFTSPEFEYGSNQFGICRYPLDSAGQRSIEELDHQTSAYACGAGRFDKSETIVLITSHKGDTPNSLYFRFNHDIVDIYSKDFGDLACDNIQSFVSRINQHMELTNQVISFNKFDKHADFNVLFSFKYDHDVKRISQVATGSFTMTVNQTKKSFTATNNALTTMASLRKMDMEFFERYYKHKIQEAMLDIGSDQLHALIDINQWSESLKSLVKMINY